VNRRLVTFAVFAVLLAPSLMVMAEEPADAAVVQKVAAGLHDGHAFGPRVRPDGKWVAYGVREEVKGTFKTSYYARDIDGGLFRSVWPNQHPTFSDGEGTASFTDLVGFEWATDGDHNAMVTLHKTKAEEVLLETMAVRFGGPGAQSQPAFAPDGTRLVVVSEGPDRSTDLWVSDTVDDAPMLQLTFTKDSETAPSWHPKEPKVIHEVRNPLGSDIYFFDLDTFEHKPLLRLGTSDEVRPSYAPDGNRFAFISNKDDPKGLRWDLFVASPGDTLPQLVIRNVRRSDQSKGYCWDPLGRYLIAVVDDEAAGYPLVIAPANGSEEPHQLPGVQTVDNMDPALVAMGSTIRLIWVALDTSRPEDKRFRVVHLADFDLGQFGELGEVAGGSEGSTRGG
jgi:Tol biopolymer transport system component